MEDPDIFDLLGKIDWEGGMDGVLDYGMRSIEEYAIPKNFKVQWAEMVEVFEEYAELRDDIFAALESYSEELPEEEY
jgi:hypothetical protein